MTADRTVDVTTWTNATLVVQHTMTGKYITPLLLHIDSPWRTSTGHHSSSPRVYAAKQTWRFWPSVVFSGLLSDVIVGVKTSSPWNWLLFILKQNGEKCLDHGDCSLNRHTSPWLSARTGVRYLNLDTCTHHTSEKKKWFKMKLTNTQEIQNTYDE